jgi:hypothetical protein
MQKIKKIYIHENGFYWVQILNIFVPLYLFQILTDNPSYWDSCKLVVGSIQHEFMIDVNYYSRYTYKKVTKATTNHQKLCTLWSNLGKIMQVSIID